MNKFLELMTITPEQGKELYQKNVDKVKTFGTIGSGLSSELVMKFLNPDFKLREDIIPLWSSEGFPQSKRFKGRLPHIAFACTAKGIEPLYTWLREVQKEFSYFSSNWVIETYYSNIGMGEEYYTVHEFLFKHYLEDKQKEHLFNLLMENMEIYLRG